MASLDMHVFYCFKTTDDFHNLEYKAAKEINVPAYSEKQAKWFLHNRDLIPSEYKYAIYRGCYGVLYYHEIRDALDHLEKQLPINNTIQIYDL